MSRSPGNRGAQLKSLFGLGNGTREHSQKGSEKDGLRWGPLNLSQDEAVQHFAAIGATGSGKTTILRLLQQDIIPSIRKGSNRRVLIYDPKQDVLPVLSGMGFDDGVINTNPFDSRSFAWDIARDVQEPRVALETAYNLFPEEQESQPYFANASRHFIYGTMISYMWRNLDWSFADVLRPLRCPKLLTRVLSACPYSKPIVTQYFKDKRSLGHVLSTAATKALAFEAIASAWEAAEQKFSIDEWARNESVLVLGSSEIGRHAIDAINRCIFKRASDSTLEMSDSATRRTWFILDELSEAGGGMLPGLVSLCKKGRSKGACVAIAFQSIAGLRQKSSYGPELTAEIMGQIGNRFIGRLECPDTAEWVAKLVGDEEIRQVTVNHTVGTEKTVSFNEQYVTRQSVLPSQFLSIPTCNIRNGLSAWYLCRDQAGVFTANLPGEELFTQDLAPLSATEPGFISRPPECQYLRKWTKEEKAMFAPKLPKKEKKNQSSETPETSRFEGLDDI
ncbi:type IV secretory system conjugative DNA transfer family protein [Crateriforma conspicua]|uniref:type IV secretory system conjugative DNA transfer family protein n=1 Tax=Crateriforma conspicua TaxID=2527996 RepID=UPI001189E2C5|nr:type IV secretion system DNA-binding domain-containing protein [Crateriforma conspicua]QDV62009.1 Coupling protein TraD [Crateriforma conspicua]